MILGQENVGKALALGMVIIVSLVMLAYAWLQRRTAQVGPVSRPSAGTGLGAAEPHGGACWPPAQGRRHGAGVPGCAAGPPDGSS